MRVPGFTSLTSTGDGLLSEAQKAMLSHLWVENVEEAISLVSAEQSASVDVEYLKPIRAALAPVLLSMSDEERGRWLGHARTPPLGCRVDPETIEAFRVTGRVGSGSTPHDLPELSLPSSVRLMDRLGPVRMQGERGTCVAFALVALREFLLTEKTRLSEQHMYWACKQLDGYAGQAGSTIHDGLSALRTYGICASEHWPYNNEVIDGNESHSPRPQVAANAAPDLKMRHTTAVSRSSVEDIKRVLAGSDGHKAMPVAVSVLVFASWRGAFATQQTGKITMPLPGEEPVGGHAMLVVGYQNDTTAPGGGYLIVRNSWSADWAAHSPEAAGHAVIPFKYFEMYTMEAFSGEDQVANNPVTSMEDGLQIVTLEEDSRDKYGKLLRAGTKVVLDPQNAGAFLRFTPANVAEISPNASHNQMESP